MSSPDARIAVVAVGVVEDATPGFAGLHAAASAVRFASRQRQNRLSRPPNIAAALIGVASSVLQTGCRVPQVVKEPRTASRKEDTS